MIFADTSAFIALLRKKDRNHGAAKAFMKTRPALLTSDYIVDEAVTLLLTRVHRAAATGLLRAITHSRFVRIEYVGEAGFTAGRALFEKYRDKDWSFTDCTSNAVMRRCSIDTAFAFDADFEQMGFRTLPEP